MFTLWNKDPSCNHSDEHGTHRHLRRIEELVVHVLKGQLKIMANVTDVKNAVAQMASDVSAEIQDAKDAILRAQNGDPAALDEVVASLNAIDTSVKDASGVFKGTNPTA